MSDFAATWTLSRQRFVDEVKDLSDQQLRWKPHVRALSIGEMALHVAGVEISFTSQLVGATLDDSESQIKQAATEGVVNSNPFPFTEGSITAEKVAKALELARERVEALITDPSEELLAMEIKSALGPMITGQGAFIRLCFHPAYHQGQAYLIKNAPGYPQ